MSVSQHLSQVMTHWISSPGIDTFLYVSVSVIIQYKELLVYIIFMIF